MGTPVLEIPHEEDFAELVQLYKNLRAHTDSKLVPDYFACFPDSLFSEPWEIYFAHPRLEKAALLCDEGRKIGFIRTGRLDTSYLSFMPNPLPESTGELHQIYLEEAYQKLGYGTLLYRRAIDDLKTLGYRHMVICTYLENTAARKFYARMGAEEWGSGELDIEFTGRKFLRPVSFMLHRNI